MCFDALSCQPIRDQTIFWNRGPLHIQRVRKISIESPKASRVNTIHEKIGPAPRIEAVCALQMSHGTYGRDIGMQPAFLMVNISTSERRCRRLSLQHHRSPSACWRTVGATVNTDVVHPSPPPPPAAQIKRPPRPPPPRHIFEAVRMRKKSPYFR